MGGRWNRERTEGSRQYSRESECSDSVSSSAIERHRGSPLDLSPCVVMRTQRLCAEECRYYNSAFLQG